MNLEDKWNEFRRECVPDDAGPVQLEQTRYAFYGGITAAMVYMTSEVADLPEEEGMKAISSMMDQIKDFVSELP